MGQSDSSGPRDADLVGAAREGDERAFEMLLRRHEGRVLRVLRLLGVPHSDREDVAQEVFVRVFRHLAGFRAGHTFEGWLYRITVNAVHDQRRRHLRRNRREADWESHAGDPADPAPGPGEIADGRDRRRSLEVALTRLSERERAVFVLCEMEGLESGRVAAALGITSVTVRRHLGRARRRLQRLLASSGAKKDADGLNAEPGRGVFTSDRGVGEPT